MAQITVMMAAYNAGKYLKRALDSILAQTFADFDVIIVDDGSKDDTGAICDAYVEADSRIHVVHQKNSGVCVTRNRCLDWAYENSDSQWITFIDSDDWVHPEMLERLLHAAQDNGVLISACGYEETTGEDPVIASEQLEPVCWKTMDFYQANYVNAIMTCCKLYHKSCYKNIRHPLDNYFDDEFVSYKMLYAQEKMAVIPAPLYAYFVNTTGLTKKKWTPKLLDAWVAYEEQIAFFTEKGRQDLVHFRYRGYLDNAMVNYAAAQEAGDAPEMVQARKKIDRHIRGLLRRMWKLGFIEFWPDFDILYTFYPTWTRLYRFWLEIKK